MVGTKGYPRLLYFSFETITKNVNILLYLCTKLLVLGEHNNLWFLLILLLLPHQNSPDTLPLISLEASALFECHNFSFLFSFFIYQKYQYRRKNTCHAISIGEQEFSQENHLCWGLFLIKLQAFSPELKKRLQHKCFLLNISKLLEKLFYRTLPVAASKLRRKKLKRANLRPK